MVTTRIARPSFSSVTWVSKFRGVLLGLALGDALGAPFEGCPTPEADAIRRHFENDQPLRWTDDTALSLVLAEQLLRCSGRPEYLVPHELLQAFVASWAADPHRGYRPGAAELFRLVQSGMPWEIAVTAVIPGGSFGNGAAMRVAPVAIAAGPEADVVELADRSAGVTHAHPLGRAGAVLQARAVRLALCSDRERELDATGFLDHLVLDADSLFALKIRQVKQLLRTAGSPEAVAAELGTGITAIESVPLALFCFLRQPDDPLETLSFAVECGGDTDTVAAMVGAMLGARNGEPALPDDLLGRLEAAHRIRELADLLYERTRPKRPAWSGGAEGS